MDEIFVHFMHLDATPNVLKQGNRQFAPEVFAKFAHHPEQGMAPVAGTRLDHGMPEIEAEQLEQGRDTIVQSGPQQADKDRVARVERNADGNGLTVTHMIAGQRFQLMRRPMPEIQWSRAAALERISGMGDLAHVQLGAAADHGGHGARLKQGEGIDMAFEPGEERGVADQTYLDGLGHAGRLFSDRQVGDEIEIVENGERRGETADEILAAFEVDAVLDADAGVILRQHRGWHPDVANAAMAGGRNQADGIENGTTTDRYHKRVPIDPVLLNETHHPFDMKQLVFDLLSARNPDRRDGEPDLRAVRRG